MISIKDLVKEHACDFCGKEKDCCVIQFADQTAGESVLCWKCLQRQAEMKLRSKQPRAAKPERQPKATEELPAAVPVNGEA